MAGLLLAEPFPVREVVGGEMKTWCWIFWAFAVRSVTNCRGASIDWVGGRAAVCHILFLSVKICLNTFISPYLIKAKYSSLCLHKREDALKKQGFPNVCFPSAELFHDTCTHVQTWEKT